MSLSKFPSRRRKDEGITLPEILITITMLGLLSAVLASAVSITLRQARNSDGRLNVARAEQSIDTWLPSDLASTDVNNVTLPAVDLDPAATPCGNCGTIDLSGANALQLAWNTTVPGSPPVDVVTRVQYQYVERGGEWVMERISCVGSEPCTVRTMLFGLEAPADLAAYDPNLDRPIWVMDVAVPESDPDLELSDNARQIVVTVDGGGSVEGAGGGENTISLTAGGRETSEIAADDFTVPSFVRARSRCGGNITLIVDESNSVSDTQMTNVVEPGVRAFIEAFRGTPTQVQLVAFNSNAESIHPSPAASADQDDGDEWHNYVDMTDDTVVDQLLARVAPQLGAPGGVTGGTNWEDAFFRALRNRDGTVADELPTRLVFFTDGEPTFHRRSSTSAVGDIDASVVHNGDLVDFNAGLYDGTIWEMAIGDQFYQEAWDRADVILDQHRDIDMIFVGVGGGLDDEIDWYHNPAAYTNPSAPKSAALSPKMVGAEALTYLLNNAPTGEVEAIWDGTEYTNPETANWYDQDSFDATQFAAAMQAAALKDCGGTLTIQTRLADGTPVDDEFVYENVEYRDESGTPIEADARRVTTSSNFRTGTFDFEIPGGSGSFSVDVVPQELQTLNGYLPSGWTCRVGGVEKTITDIPIDGSFFSGFTIDIAANEAASCILTVTN